MPYVNWDNIWYWLKTIKLADQKCTVTPSPPKKTKNSNNNKNLLFSYVLPHDLQEWRVSYQKKNYTHVYPEDMQAILMQSEEEPTLLTLIEVLRRTKQLCTSQLIDLVTCIFTALHWIETSQKSFETKVWLIMSLLKSYSHYHIWYHNHYKAIMHKYSLEIDIMFVIIVT